MKRDTEVEATFWKSCLGISPKIIKTSGASCDFILLNVNVDCNMQIKKICKLGTVNGNIFAFYIKWVDGTIF